MTLQELLSEECASLRAERDALKAEVAAYGGANVSYMEANQRLGRELTALKAEHARYKAGLEDIEELLTGELRARFGPAEAAPKSSRIVGLLRIPRNMARAALAAEQGTP